VAQRASITLFDFVSPTFDFFNFNDATNVTAADDFLQTFKILTLNVRKNDF
jgi:hypothetical protein